MRKKGLELPGMKPQKIPGQGERITAGPLVIYHRL
jgi:hypothetical protein